jgi:predicted RNA-binding protein associated with RNAse of E/G family
VDLADVDELLDAVRHGLLTPEVGESAVRRAVHAVDGLAGNGYDLAAWLAAEGMQLMWR